jgi:hypothetical protein
MQDWNATLYALPLSNVLCKRRTNSVQCGSNDESAHTWMGKVRTRPSSNALNWTLTKLIKGILAPCPSRHGQLRAQRRHPHQ